MTSPVDFGHPFFRSQHADLWRFGSRGGNPSVGRRSDPQQGTFPNWAAGNTCSHWVQCSVPCRETAVELPINRAILRSENS